MREDDGLLGIDAAGQVVHHHVVHVVLDVLGGVAIGDHLVVGDDDARGYAMSCSATRSRMVPK